MGLVYQSGADISVQGTFQKKVNAFHWKVLRGKGWRGGMPRTRAKKPRVFITQNLCRQKVERLPIEIRTYHLKFNRITESKLFLCFLSRNRICLFIKRVEIIAEIAELDHSF